MVILSQSKTDKSFFIGMSFEEYFEQVKPLKTCMNKDMLSEEKLLQFPMKERICGDYKEMIINEYGCPEIFDVYVVVQRNLVDAFIAMESFPFGNQWNGYSPWRKFPATKIENINEIKNIEFINYEGDE